MDWLPSKWEVIVRFTVKHLLPSMEGTGVETFDIVKKSTWLSFEIEVI